MGIAPIKVLRYRYRYRYVIFEAKIQVLNQGLYIGTPRVDLIEIDQEKMNPHSIWEKTIDIE